MNFIIFITFFSIFSLLSILIKTNFIKKLKLSFNSLVFIVFGIALISVFLYKQQALDVFLFSDAGHYLRQKIDFYWIDSDHNKYPFFPFLIFLFAFFDYLTEILPLINFMILVKLILIIPLLYISNWLKDKNKFLEFILSPIVYAVIFYHGQIDIILMAFFILGIEYWNKISKKKKHSSNAKNFILSTVFYTASVASKTWSILFAPIWLWYNKKDFKSYLLFFITGILLFLNILFYTRYVVGSGIKVVVPALLSPGGSIGHWGITLIPQLQPFILSYKLWLYALLLGVGYIIILRKKISFYKAITLFIFWLYIVAIHWAVQYLIWLLPFALYYKKWLGEKWFNAYHILGSIYVFMIYADISLGKDIFPEKIVDSLGLLLWLLFCYKFFEKTTSLKLLDRIKKLLKTS